MLALRIAMIALNVALAALGAVAALNSQASGPTIVVGVLLGLSAVAMLAHLGFGARGAWSVAIATNGILVALCLVAMVTARVTLAMPGGTALIAGLGALLALNLAYLLRRSFSA